MPPVVVFDPNGLFAICAVSHLIRFRGKRFRYIYNVRFRYLQVCNLRVFTIRNDKSSLKCTTTLLHSNF